MISAIIVNYHLADSAIRAVRSLLPASASTELEIWLVDNSESAREVSKLAETVGDICHLIANDSNVGFASACNQAYARSRGQWILLLNPDAYLAPHALERMRAFLDGHTDAGAVGPRIFWDAERRALLPPSLTFSPIEDLALRLLGRAGGAFTWFISMLFRTRARRYWRASSPLRAKNLSGGHVLLRREAVERAGGLFDPRFFLYFEDTDLFLRLRQAGYRLYVLPDAAVVHEFGASARDRIEWKQEKMTDSHRQFVHKHYARHWLRRLGDTLTKHGPARAWTPTVQDMGVRDTPPVLPVPSAWRDGWLMEWGLTPYFVPAAGCFGTGREAVVPASVWSIMAPGKVFMRIGPSNGFWTAPRIWQVEKQAQRPGQGR